MIHWSRWELVGVGVAVWAGGVAFVRTCPERFSRVETRSLTRALGRTAVLGTLGGACVDLDDGDGDGDGDHELSSALYFWGYGGNKKSEFSDELKALLSEVRQEEPRFVRVRRIEEGGKGRDWAEHQLSVFWRLGAATRDGWNLSRRPPTRPPTLLPPVSSPHVS